MAKKIFNIPYVQRKQDCVDNDVAQDVKQLAIEDAELAKALALNPSRPDAGRLSSRQAAIRTAIAAHE